MTEGDNSARNKSKYVTEEMTLLDWFAGQALVGLLANEGVDGADDAPFRGIATAAYMAAHDMMMARDDLKNVNPEWLAGFSKDSAMTLSSGDADFCSH